MKSETKEIKEKQTDAGELWNKSQWKFKRSLAVRGISNPAFLILMSNAEQFETHVAELEELYPGVPSIGCIGMSYQTSVTEKGVSVTAFEGVEAVTDVLEQASIMPVKYISGWKRRCRR